ncbi:MAG: hypothetical protein EPO65_06745 [Dehalococcoidia bacterium]|nr:MAG: hypothetical protein EPO65_06745 [Dehalococcoidia bacterium]
MAPRTPKPSASREGRDSLARAGRNPYRFRKRPVFFERGGVFAFFADFFFAAIVRVLPGALCAR